MPSSIGDLGDEAKGVDVLLDRALSVGSTAVPLVHVDAHQDWLVGIHFLSSHELEVGHVLVGVEWNDAIVVVAGRYKHGRVSLISYIVVRRVLDQVIVRALTIGEAILCLPEMTTCELMEPEHVGHRHLGNGTGEKLRALIRRHCHQCSAIGPTQGHKMLVVGKSTSLQVLRRSNEIIKCFEPSFLDGLHVPLFSEFSAAPYVRHDIQSVKIV